MPFTSTRTRKRLVRARRIRERESTVQAPVRNRLFFRFDASLRIAGIGAWHENITQVTGLVPFQAHRKGEARSRFSTKLGVWPEDQWRLQSPLPESASLEEHVQWLWQAIAPHRRYFEGLIAQATWADLCLGCLSESVYPFFGIKAETLEITRALPLGLSFNFTVT